MTRPPSKDRTHVVLGLYGFQNKTMCYFAPVMLHCHTNESFFQFNFKCEVRGRPREEGVRKHRKG